MKKFAFRLAAMALLINGFVATTTFAQPADSAAALSGLDQRISRMMQDWNVPGAAVAIVSTDEVLLAEGFGVLEVGSNRKVDSQSLFAIGSASKSFTAAALAILVDEGKLSWDDRVTDHLPWFQMYDPYVTREIRIRDLLAHNSGLSRGDRIWYGTDLSREEVVRRARFMPPAHSFRATFEYNNTMFIAAGLVIEEITGQSWDDFITARIFQPLGMDASNTSVKALADQPNVSTPHMDFDGVAKAVPWRDIDNAGPAGSINSSVDDMVHYAQLMLNQGKLGDEQLLSPAAMQQLLGSQMKMTKDGFWGVLFADSAIIAYGLGWFLAEHQGYLMPNHGGNIDGNTAFVSFMPEKNIGVVILSNMNRANGFIAALNYEIYDRLLGAPQKDWNQQFLQVMERLRKQQQEAAQKVVDARVAGTSPSLALDEYSGRYTSELYPDVVVENTADGLVLTYAGNFRATLAHWNYDTFKATWNTPDPVEGPPSLVRFAMGTDAKVYKVHVDIEGSVPFKKAK
jgi:CubicO group peptidase (beta-lactamase class C family)